MVRLARDAGAPEGPGLLDPLPGRGETGEKGAFECLLGATFKRARGKGLIDPSPRRRWTRTGLETHHASRTSAGAAALADHARELAQAHGGLPHRSHLIAGAVACRGPCQDSPQFEEAMRCAAANLQPHRVLADKGYGR